MNELSDDAAFISLLCDAGCSERPTVSTILETSIPILISFCIKLCVGVHGLQMSSFKKHNDYHSNIHLAALKYSKNTCVKV